MNLDNLVIKFCIEGTQAEFQGQIEQARSLFQKDWEAAQDNYDGRSAPACLLQQTLPELTVAPYKVVFCKKNSPKTGFFTPLYGVVFVSGKA
jgi:hypothetical protein